MGNKIFSLDRLEGDLAISISDDDEIVAVPIAALGGLCVRDVFSARVEGDTLSDIVPRPDERDRRIEDSRARLHALAGKSKNKP